MKKYDTINSKISVQNRCIMFKEFVMENNPTAFCHASTIVKLRTGGFMCCWFGGTHEGNADVAIYGSRNTGAGWTVPEKLADGVEANWNPVLFYRGDGVLQLFYKEGQKIAIVGPTGAGKTTILRLLLGIVKWLLFILFTIVLLFLYYKPGRYSIRFGNVYYQFLSEGAGFARYKLDADAKTFKIYMDNPTYGTDKNSAYHFEHKINGSHGPSFILLKGNYQKDKNHVYYRDRIVPHADPKTFIGPLIEDENSSTPRSYAEDRYDFYHEGLPIHVYDKETYFKENEGRLNAEMYVLKAMINDKPDLLSAITRKICETCSPREDLYTSISDYTTNEDYRSRIALKNEDGTPKLDKNGEQIYRKTAETKRYHYSTEMTNSSEIARWRSYVEEKTKKYFENLY